MAVAYIFFLILQPLYRINVLVWEFEWYSHVVLLNLISFALPFLLSATHGSRRQCPLKCQKFFKVCVAGSNLRPKGLFGKSRPCCWSTLHFQLKASGNMHLSLMCPSIQAPPSVTHTPTQCTTCTLTTSAVCKQERTVDTKIQLCRLPTLFASRVKY